MPGSPNEVASNLKGLEISPSAKQASSKIYKNSASLGGGDTGGKKRAPSKRMMKEKKGEGY